MTSHAVVDELYTGAYAAVRDAYRVGEGNSTIRGECESQVCWIGVSWATEQSGFEVSRLEKERACIRYASACGEDLNFGLGR